MSAISYISRTIDFMTTKPAPIDLEG